VCWVLCRDNSQKDVAIGVAAGLDYPAGPVLISHWPGLRGAVHGAGTNGLFWSWTGLAVLQYLSRST